MAEESDLERTEPASQRRIEQAREQGNVPQSRELTAFLVLASGVGALWIFGDWFSQRSKALVGAGLKFDRQRAFDPEQMAIVAADLGTEGLFTLAPLFLLTLMAAMLAPASIGGFVFSGKAMQFDLGRIDPMRGLGRMFSWQAVAELVKALLKSALVGGVLYWVVRYQQEDLFALITQPVESGLAAFVRLVLVATIALVAGLAVIAILDVPFQLWQYYDRLKMTREELRQEHKEMEGDPQLKARIRSQQREIARRRMMSEVPKADVVVTNPNHFAVALRYEAGKMTAPQVVAKGMNMVALRIREIAAENRVPILEAPPLARALHRHAELGDVVPAALYTAVAEVMAWVYQLNQYAKGAGGAVPPSVPRRIEVPDGMDPGAPREVPLEAGAAA